MRISTKGYYAVMAMIDLTANSQNYPVPLSNISIRQGISLHYLEQLFMKLRKAKLVKSIRGPGGGYVLARDMDNINIEDILQAVDESITPIKCLSKGTKREKKDVCKRVDNCISRKLWERLAESMSKTLQSITLGNLYKDSKKVDNENEIRHTYSFSI